MPSKPKVRCQCGKIRRSNDQCACGRGGPRRSGWADKRRLPPHKRGYDWAWHKFSKAFRRSHPLCAECEKQGRVVVSEQVHHVVPIAVDPSRRFDTTNCVALCKKCHDDKTTSSDSRNTYTQGVSRRPKRNTPCAVVPLL